MFNALEFHVTLWLAFNDRLARKDWRNATEETIVRSSEAYHLREAEKHLPKTLVCELGFPPTKDEQFPMFPQFTLT